jgi:hypothetical protein
MDSPQFGSFEMDGQKGRDEKENVLRQQKGNFVA